MAKNYIKVTPKGEKRSFILQASLENHYRSLGATIEEPTEEEIAAAYPEVQAAKEEADNATQDAANNYIAELEDEITGKDAEIADLKKKIEENNAEIATLKEEREALKLAIKEAEALAAKNDQATKKTSK